MKVLKDIYRNLSGFKHGFCGFQPVFFPIHISAGFEKPQKSRPFHRQKTAVVFRLCMGCIHESSQKRVFTYTFRLVFLNGRKCVNPPYTLTHLHISLSCVEYKKLLWYKVCRILFLSPFEFFLYVFMD